MRAAPTLLFGLGATKAGSSWLYHQLAAHPETALRRIKELHYFDCISEDHWGREIRKHKKALNRLSRKTDAEFKRTDVTLSQLILDRADWLNVLEARRYDPTAYLDYLLRNLGSAKLVGEITPAYALLSEEWLERMVGLAAETRFVYVIRDPLDRLWSNVRMTAKARAEENEVLDARAHRVLKRMLNGKEDHLVRRSDYRTILPKLQRTIPKHQLMIIEFEHLVAGEGYRDLCGFLGLEPMEPDRGAAFAGSRVTLQPEARAAALNWLRPQYAAAEAVLGALPESWNSP